jgi:hypothetical protein
MTGKDRTEDQMRREAAHTACGQRRMYLTSSHRVEGRHEAESAKSMCSDLGVMTPPHFVFSLWTPRVHRDDWFS